MATFNRKSYLTAMRRIERELEALRSAAEVLKAGSHARAIGAVKDAMEDARIG